jgi:hypothetical protein
MSKQDQDLISARLRDAIAVHEERRQKARKGEQRDHL